MVGTLDGIVNEKRINDQIDAGCVRPFIEKEIVAHLLEDARGTAASRAENIVDKYKGQEFNVLMVLRYAADEGKFFDIAKKLESFYEGITKRRSEHLEKKLDVSRIMEQRKLSYEMEVDGYLEGLYKELGVSPAEL